MNQSPLISVIIPIYKVENYLQPCVDSVLAQTYQNLEVILVDDGSPDNCGKLCDAYAEKDKRIVVIHKPNGGLSDARNAGLDVCKGELIAFVDSDDLVHHQFIELLYNGLTKNNADMAFCGVSKFYDDDNVDDKITNSSANVNMVLFDQTQMFDELLFERRSVYEHIVSWNKLYTKKIWDVLRFPKGRIHEDEFVIHHILDLCEKITYIDSALYFYRQRKDSIMFVKRTAKQLLDKYYAFEDRKAYFRKKGIKHTALNEKQKFALWDSFFIIADSPLKDVENFGNIIKDDLSAKTKVKLLLKRYTPGFFHFILKVGEGHSKNTVN
ncbi:glycosyltransferase family 2 protein [Mucilaginibacter auburnensis]|uniref:Glycosyltransferase involved in cell wall biosynthesis n=1 Tax=Mucilaginibacter auburnensis TaxID=1457233 RepID=A0A2H9VTC1_9SPHI|nr:glycosyltransferase [Mucilaginibacter auburnensis]PJJ84049.1 glycosyltransferase involved in cell wall biosynthesis [Mucilaginibacter auburnensis]